MLIRTPAIAPSAKTIARTADVEIAIRTMMRRLAVICHGSVVPCLVVELNVPVHLFHVGFKLLKDFLHLVCGSCLSVVADCGFRRFDSAVVSIRSG